MSLGVYYPQKYPTVGTMSQEDKPCSQVALDPILKHDSRRFVLFPIQYPEVNDILSVLWTHFYFFVNVYYA